MPCERCLNRREFLAQTSGGVAIAAALTACGDGFISGTTADVIRLPPNQPPSGQVTIVVANFPALATEGVVVKVSTFFAAKRTGPAAFDAFSMACTHEGCLTEIAQNQQFHCPCHGSRFDNAGAVLEGPADRPLQKLATSYNPGTDVLTIN